jgi:hypothetical protein
MNTPRRRLWLRERCRCAECGREFAAVIPRGGDGSAIFPARHRRYVGKELRQGWGRGPGPFCEGRFMPGKPVENAKVPT